MLTYRKPAPLFVFLGWLFSGPLNLAALVVIALGFVDSGNIKDNISSASFLFMIPAAVGMTFVLFHLHRKPVDTSRLLKVALVSALIVAALYPVILLTGPALVVLISSLTLDRTFRASAPMDASEILAGLFMLPLLGITIGFPFALVAGLSGALMLRLLTFTYKKEE